MNLLDLMVTIGLRDEASPHLDSVSNKLGKGLQTAAKIGVAAVTAAATAVGALAKQSLDSYAEYEQLAGGAEKIFDQIDISSILADAQNAYISLGMSANEYLSVINDVGASFAATMGDEAGYEAAKQGLQAISDYASGTGKNVNELAEKFTMITRSTASYQSIADQFSGILPATSQGFLDQAQAAGLLAEEYTSLTEVPIDEYQAAVAAMLEKGVAELGLANNTAAEAFTTISGSLAATKAAWSNLVTGLADDNANFEQLIGNFVESISNAFANIEPRLVQIFSGISTVAATLIPQIINMIVANLPLLLDAGTQIIVALGGAILQNLPLLLETAIELITNLIEYISENATQFVTAAVAIVLAISNALLENAPQLLGAMGMLMAQLVIGIIQNIPQILVAAAELLASLILSLQAAVQQFSDVAGEWINSIISKIGEKLGELVDAGAQVVQSIKDGISAAWDGLVSWFEGIWSSLFSNRSVDVGVNYGGGADSDNAIGLDYVPFNGYMANLHRGEAVLTAREAADWRSRTGGGSQPIVLTIHNITELDGAEVARKTYTYNLAEQNKHGAKLINT